MTSEPSLRVAGSTLGWDARLVAVSDPVSTLDDWASLEDKAFTFGRFRLIPSSRVLLRDEAPVPLGSRAFDLLHALLLSRGKVLSTPDIIRSVWPSTTVDECNVRFQVACLRKALGKDRDLIKTVAGRGYLLVDEPVSAVAYELSDGTRSFAAGLGFLPALAEGLRPPTAPLRPVEDLAQNLEALQDLLRSALEELHRMSLRGAPDYAVQRPEDRTFLRAAPRPALSHRL